MKKNTTIIALGIILSSTILPIVSQAETTIVSTISSPIETITNPSTLSPELDSSSSILSDSSESEVGILTEDVPVGQITPSEPIELEDVTASEITITDVTKPVIEESSLQTASENIMKLATNTYSWMGLTLTLDEDGTLHIPTGSITNPTPLYETVYSGLVKKIIIDGNLLISGSAYRLFENLDSLTSIENSSNIDTSQITSMNTMFNGCKKLTSLDVSNWDTSNVTNMYYMFNKCENLTSLDVSNWDTSNVNSMYYTFGNCEKLTSLDVSNWDTSNVTDMTSTFAICKSLTSVDVSNWDTSNVTEMGYMFIGCSALTSVDVSNWNTSNVTEMSLQFSGCKKLMSLDVSNWDTSNVTGIVYMFQRCVALESLDVSNWDTSNVTSMHGVFEDCLSVQSLDVSNWDTSNVTSMYSTFKNCGALTSLDVSNWDTSNVTTMEYLFHFCSKLASLDLSNFNTDKVTTMNRMFSFCSRLKELTLSKNFRFGILTDIPNIPKFHPDSYDVVYTGFWQNVATGTVDDPKGNNIWTSEELMANYNGLTDEDTYVWQKKSPVKAADVTVKYVDVNGKSIADSVTLSGNIGEAYSSVQKDIKGYTFKEIQGNAKGTFSDMTQTVTYFYSKDAVKAADVTVKYVDMNGNSIADSVTLSGNTGEAYSSVQKDIKGYSFKEVQGKPTGTLTDKAQTITYFYMKDAVKAADVTVKYVDMNGNSIADSVTLIGNIGETYSSVQKDIKGYTFKELKGNPNGTYADSARIITYIYSKDNSSLITAPESSPSAKPNIPSTNTGTTTQTGNATQTSTFPQTGNKEAILAIKFGTSLLALLSGFYFLKKKEDTQK